MEEKFNVEVNQRVAQIRQELNLTQAEFAESVGVNRVTVSNIEREMVAVSEQTLLLLHLVHHVSIEYLKEGIGDMFDYGVAQECEFKRILKSLSPENRRLVYHLGVSLVNITRRQQAELDEMLRKDGF